MIGRIIEIASDGRYLSTHRGFLLVSHAGEEQGRQPLDDIAAVIANAHGISYSNNLLVALSQRGIPLVTCADNHAPAAFLWPIEGHNRQAARMDAQIAASKPTHKRLWQQIVRAKLTHQAAVLLQLGYPTAPITALIPKVRSGDPENIEAQGARRYWRALFGNDFRRDRTTDGINSLLNYGYTVLRAATARAVIAAGLHPTLGIHHRNGSNPMRLVDDLMEPFRPAIDNTVYALQQEEHESVTPESKQRLVSTLYLDLALSDGKTPLMVCLQRLATSLAQLYCGERRTLELPRSYGESHEQTQRVSDDVADGDV